MTAFEQQMLRLREREVRLLEDAQRRAIATEQAKHPSFTFNHTHYTWVNGAYEGRYIGACAGFH